MFGRDMPKPGPILSDQCRIFANLFIVGRSSRGLRALLWEDLVPGTGQMEESDSADG